MTITEETKERLRDYGKVFSLEKLRDSYLDSVRLINEVIREKEDNKMNLCSCIMCHREFEKWSTMEVHFNRNHYNDYAAMLRIKRG